MKNFMTILVLLSVSIIFPLMVVFICFLMSLKILSLILNIIK